MPASAGAACVHARAAAIRQMAGCGVGDRSCKYFVAKLNPPTNVAENQSLSGQVFAERATSQGRKHEEREYEQRWKQKQHKRNSSN